MMDDRSLLREWATERSEEAFGSLVERYAPLVWGVVSRKLFDRSAAEDAMQRVFIVLARKAPLLVRNDRPLAPWLHRCASLEALQEMRREGRRLSLLTRFVPLAEGEEDSPGFSPDSLEHLLPHLDEALLELGEQDRQTLLRHFYDRHSYPQIALETGSSEAAVQRRGHRALRKLATILERRGAVVSLVTLSGGFSLLLCPPVPAAILSTVRGAVMKAAVPPPGPPARDWLSTPGSLKTAALLAFGLGLGLPLAQAWRAFPEKAAFFSGISPESPVVPEPQAAKTPAAAEPLDLAALRRDMESVPDLPDAYPLMLKLRRLMYALTPQEIPAVHGVLTTLSARARLEGSVVYNDFFGRWAEQDAPAAVNAAWEVCRTGDSGSYWTVGRNSFAQWMLADPGTAWDWMTAHARTVLDWRRVASCGLDAMAADPANRAAAFKLTDAVPLDEAKKELRVNLATPWLLSADQAAAVDWLRENYSPEVINTLLERVGWEAGRDQREPQKAADLLAFMDVSAARSAGGELFRNWIARRPEEALDALLRKAALLPVRSGQDPEGSCFYAAGQAMMRHGRETVLAAAGKIPEGPGQRDFDAGILSRLAGAEAAEMKSALGALNYRVNANAGSSSGSAK
ncbi:MAG: sigma-70 family RNA polymerase sigma factor [Verrucomicrobiota bacterium]